MQIFIFAFIFKINKAKNFLKRKIVPQDGTDKSQVPSVLQVSAEPPFIVYPISQVISAVVMLPLVVILSDPPDGLDKTSHVSVA
jgi:hypothetical protein